MSQFIEVNRAEWLAQLSAFVPQGDEETETVTALTRAASPPENSETVCVLASHAELIQSQPAEE